MKSNESDLVELAVSIYNDVTAKCPAEVSDLRDVKTLISRVKNEGISFLTITLPEFGKSLDRALELGHVDSTMFPMFWKHLSIPVFLQGLTSRIFDVETGRIHDETSRFYPSIPIFVDCVRQFCLAFKKIEIECTPKRVQKALDNFAAIERSFESFMLPEEELESFRLCSSVLWDGMLPGICLDDAILRHGPGATAERISGNRKFVWRSWHDRIEPYFPFLGSVYSINAFGGMEFEKLTVVKERDELPVRVTPVPKTLKGPRIIAIEPTCMQFVQQGIRGVLYDSIESYWLTTGHINFRDQKINQSLAMRSSSDGRLATIDLSDASDRVPYDTAMVMFESNPDLSDAIRACRSSHANLPDGRIIGPLKKFASMGSALCFPIEAMYFYTVCVKALMDDRKLPYTRENIFEVSRDVYVYGDDIVVPCANAGIVLDYLHRYNCKVNAAKSFWNGKFRESCGEDAYNGFRVTPVYIRQLPPESKRDSTKVVSWCATMNALYKKGLYRSARLLRKRLELLLGPLPHVDENFGGLGVCSFDGYNRPPGRWNRKYHRFEVKAWVPSPVYRTDPLEGYSALQKSLLNLSLRISEEGCSTVGPRPIMVDDQHLERSALYGAVALKRRWVPIQ